MTREHERVRACIERFANGERAKALGEAQQIVRAFAAAELKVLFPMLGRVRLRPEVQHLLADAQDDRSRELASLETLAHTRGARARKLAAVQLMDQLREHVERRTLHFNPTLASQLPRVQYRAVVEAFIRCYESAGDTVAMTEPKPRSKAA
ncbi:MAG TPA: hypothetical protein VL326_37115 [Kofleriaceae bacterium]|jgi:hypothetical protein|nr:hypothetical protein [Kofleriaceae bacterium]